MPSGTRHPEIATLNRTALMGLSENWGTLFWSRTFLKLHTVSGFPLLVPLAAR